METRITVGGADPERGGSPPTSRPARIVALVAVVATALGVVFGAAFASPRPEEDAVPDAGPVAEPAGPGRAPSTTTTTSVPRPDRLAVRVPGIVDTLVLVSTALGGESEVSVWEATDRSPSERALPAAEMHADASGQWLMTVTDGRLSDLRALWVGNALWMEPVATAVVAATWHARFPGRIAWVESRDTGPTLMTATFLPGRPVEIDEVGPVEAPASPVWYGDEGILLQSPDGLALVDDEDGTPIAAFGGASLVGGGTDGLLVRLEDPGAVDTAEDDPAGTTPTGPSVFAAPGSLDVLVRTDIHPDCIDATFSASGTFAALRCPHLVAGDWTVEIWGLGLLGVERGVRAYAETVAWASAPAWSPDGRFVLYSVPDQVRPRSTIVFVGTDTWAGTAIVHPGMVTSLAMLRS